MMIVYSVLCVSCSVGYVCTQVAVKTLPFYKEYFKIAYPLPKMDLIAIQVSSARTALHY